MRTVGSAVGLVALALVLVRAAKRGDASARARSLRRARAWRVPAQVRAPLKRALVAADLDVIPETAVVAWATTFAGALMVTIATVPTLLVASAAVCTVGPPVALLLSRGRHERRFAGALPAVLEQAAAELRGGGSIATAIERLATSGGPVARDLGRVHGRTRLGLGLGEALAAWPLEHDAPGVRAAAGALAVAADLGGRAADAIDGLASSLRHRLDAIAEARALSTQARMSAVVVGAAPLGYLAFASVLDPRAVGVLLGTGVGRVCLLVGLALEAAAAWWIRRIVAAEAR